MNPAYTITNDCVSVVIRGEVITVRRGSVNFEAARQAVINEQWEGIEKVLIPGHAVEKWLGKGFFFREGVIFYGEDKIDPRLSERMVKMAAQGDNPTALMKFWRRLQHNPSMRSVEQLYGFLENKGIPIDDEGFILAYKAIRADYKDFHSGKCDNTVGQVLSMPRNRISDDPNQACHYGFHVGALEYASTFGGSDRRIVVCRVDPADVVCVPYDHSMQKVRVCRYEVLSEHGDQSFLSDTYHPSDPDFSNENEGEYYKDYPEDVESSGNTPDFENMTVENLRRWARNNGIRNPGSIRGGKAALIQKIKETVQSW